MEKVGNCPLKMVTDEKGQQSPHAACKQALDNSRQQQQQKRQQ